MLHKETLLVLAFGFFAGAAHAAPGPVSVEVVNADPIPVTVETKAGPPATHMGVAATEHVTLYWGSSTTQTCAAGTATAIRQSPFGGFFGNFIVPAGKALVITDVTIGIFAAAGAAWPVGTTLAIRLSGVSTTPLWQKEFYVDATEAAARKMWRSETIASGVVFGPGRVCAEVPSIVGAFVNSSMAHGYLIDAPLN
jgi:hypothetical protein